MSITCGSNLIYSFRNLVDIPSYVCENPDEPGTFDSCEPEYICANLGNVNY